MTFKPRFGGAFFCLAPSGAGLFFFSASPAARSQPDFKAHFTAFRLRRYRILPAVKRALWALTGVGVRTAQYSQVQPSTAQDVPSGRRQAPQRQRRRLDRLTTCAGSARPRWQWSDAEQRSDTAQGQRLPCQAPASAQAVQWLPDSQACALGQILGGGLAAVRHCRHSQRSAMQPAAHTMQPDTMQGRQDASQREHPECPRWAADQAARGEPAASRDWSRSGSAASQREGRGAAVSSSALLSSPAVCLLHPACGIVAGTDRNSRGIVVAPA